MKLHSQDPPIFYYVVEHESFIVRAAQTRLRDALRYSTPERFIAGPMTSDELHRLFPETVRS